MGVVAGRVAQARQETMLSLLQLGCGDFQLWRERFGVGAQSRRQVEVLVDLVAGQGMGDGGCVLGVIGARVDQFLNLPG